MQRAVTSGVVISTASICAAALLLVAGGALETTRADATLEASPHCLADFNSDHAITGSDLSVIAGNIGNTVPPAPAESDLTADGGITGADLSVVAGKIGRACQDLPPEGCSDWYQEYGRWEYSCYSEGRSWWSTSHYYWNPDSETAVYYMYCYGPLPPEVGAVDAVVYCDGPFA